MKSIKKLWVRILLSLILGGMLAEAVHIKTGNDSASNILVFIGAGIAFFLFTLLIIFDKYKYYFFPNQFSKNDGNEDILDDLE